MKLNKQVECTWKVSELEKNHLQELSLEIAELIKNIVKESNLNSTQKIDLENLDKLSLLKVAWKIPMIKTIISDCINDDIHVYENEKWRRYQLEIFWSKYYLETCKALNTQDWILFDLEWVNIDKLIIVLSNNEWNLWSVNSLTKYNIIYKVDNFDK